MGKIILSGRGAMPGVIEGPALVSRETIMGWNGVDVKTGLIIEQGHPLAGKNLRGSVLILPGSKGSNGWSCHFHALKMAGAGPAAMIFPKMDSRAAVAAVVLQVPVVTDLCDDPFALIATGDWIRVDGDHGIIEVLRRAFS